MKSKTYKIIKKTLALCFLIGTIGLAGCKMMQEQEDEIEIIGLSEEWNAENTQEKETEDVVFFDRVSNMAVIVDPKTRETEKYQLAENSSHVHADEEKLYYVYQEQKKIITGYVPLTGRSGKISL